MTSPSPAIKKAEFLRSCFSLKDLPREEMPEIAFAGRSNVGKSSLLNAIMGRKRLVKVSSSPGFTQSLNFFLVNNSAYFVDLPGYGYAKAPRNVIRRWQRLVEGYLSTRKTLKGVVCIFDIRRDLDDLDLGLIEYLRFKKVRAWIVLNKADKLSGNRVHAKLREIALLLPREISRPWVVSARTGEGVKELVRSVILPGMEEL